MCVLSERRYGAAKLRNFTDVFIVGGGGKFVPPTIQREFVTKSIGDIDLRNPQDTWKQIGKIFNIRKRQPHGTGTVSAEQFYEYFKQQNAVPTNGDQTDLKDTGVIEEEAGPPRLCNIGRRN